MTRATHTTTTQFFLFTTDFPTALITKYTATITTARLIVIRACPGRPAAGVSTGAALAVGVGTFTARADFGVLRAADVVYTGGIGGTALDRAAGFEADVAAHYTGAL